jgi:hypothetical protein
MTKHSDQALPCLQLLLAKGASEIRNYDELVGQASLAESASDYAPTAGASAGAWKCALERLVRFPGEALGEPERIGCPSEEAFPRSAEQSFARTVYKPQAVACIEGENRDIDLLHHFPQQGSRLKSAEPLRTQRGTHGVDLLHHFAERVFVLRSAEPDGVVAFAHGFEQVREGSQGGCDPFASCEGTAPPEAEHQHAERPAHFGRIVFDPKDRHGDNERRQTRQQRQQ